MDFDIKKMRARFAALRKERDKIEKTLKPMQDQMTKLRTDAAVAEKALADKIIKTRAPLVDIDTEMSMLNRLLKGKTQ